MATQKLETIIQMIEERGYTPKQIVQKKELRQELGMSTDTLISYLEWTGDTKLIESIIESKELTYELLLNARQLSRLVKSLHSTGYVEKLLKDKHLRKKTCLYPSDVVELVADTHDVSLIRSLLEDSKLKQEYKLHSDTICGLVLATEDAAFIEKVLEDENYAKKIGMEPILKQIVEKLELIMATHDAAYIRKCFEEPQRISELDLKHLSSVSIVNLILSAQDVDFIKSFLENQDKLDEFHLGYYEELSLLIATRDEKYIQDFLDHLAKELHLGVDESLSFKLPPELTIGVELETENTPQTRKLLLKLGGMIGKNYTAEVDLSVPDGMEVQSPIMHGGSKEDVMELQRVCNRLKCFHQRATEHCGGHIHIGADYLSSEESLKNFSEMWLNMEKVFLLISNQPGELPRENVLKYAPPISKLYEQDVQSDGTIQLSSEEELLAYMKEKQNERKHYGVNYLNIGNQEKNTFEFRMHNATIDKHLIENVNLDGAMVVAAEELYQISIKNDKTPEEERKLALFERIKQENVPDEEKLEYFLELAILEEDRDIYRRRYEVNQKLLRLNPEQERKIDEHIAKRAIVFQFPESEKPQDKPSQNQISKKDGERDA